METKKLHFEIVRKRDGATIASFAVLPFISFLVQLSVLGLLVYILAVS